MKKIIAMLISLIAITVHASKIELVSKDGYQPLAVDNRVIFFVTKEDADNELMPKGTSALFLVTVNCDTKLHKRSLTEIYDSTTNVVTKMFKTDQDIADSMINQRFTAIDSDLITISTKLCTDLIKK